MGYHEGIIDVDLSLAEANRPDIDTATGVSCKELAIVAELKTVRVDLVEDGAFGRLIGLFISVGVLNFALRSHNQSKGFVLERISLVHVLFLSVYDLWRVHHGQFLHKFRNVGIKVFRYGPVANVALPDAHFLIETGRGDDELSGGAIARIGVDLRRVDKAGMHKRLAQEELVIILGVVEPIADLFVLRVEFPDFG